MFARFLELQIKPEKKSELITTMKNDVLPVLRKCQGFFDLIPLEVETDPTKFYVMSLWHEKRDAETFHREQFPKVKPMYEQFLTAPVKTCESLAEYNYAESPTRENVSLHRERSVRVRRVVVLGKLNSNVAGGVICQRP